MSSVHLRQLVNPTAEELDRAAATVAEAYRNDLWSKMLLGGDLTLLYPFRRAMLASYVHIGEIWVAEHGGNGMAGVAAFIRPGQDLSSSEAQKAEIAAFFEKLPPDVQRWWADCLGPRLHEQEMAALGEGVVTDAWNLCSLGTHPAHRGHGIAKALTEVIKQKAAVDGTLVTMLVTEDTTRNVEMYKRWGFEVKGNPADFTSPVGACTAWIMARPSP